ncbi:LysR family transcriptional regulator [Vibrio chagasii]|uniref:LysR family transcriptional regulator n=2 Tax=Vibrionaceae TaxID=641 RepID=UPI00200ED170|nr:MULTISPECIES: LysR family transcriptional regulator [Vibrio]MCK8069918.1 LysR family transcriptional regulator [Vibrio sp. 1CM23M]UPR32876.1 LysR family transcriptional regulator [Vibrio crassostreae]CAH7134768.1 LysR family transcriptional regulator [Vibrio chagasii]
MDKIECIRIFVETAQLNSFTATANKLDMTQSAVSKKIAWLESDLGMTLFQRNSRKISLTHAGKDYLTYCVRFLEEMSAIESQLKRETESVEGELKISAPSAFSTMLLSEPLQAFIEQHPGIRINLSVDDRIVNLNEHNINVAIRASQLKDSGLKARLLFNNKVHYFASPAYLEKHGAPQQPQELSKHHCLTYSLMTPANEWRFTDKSHKASSIKVNQIFTSDSPEMLLKMSRQGLGIVALPNWMGKEFVEKGELIRLLADWSNDQLPMYAVYHASDYLPQRIRVFIDFLAEYLSSRNS